MANPTGSIQDGPLTTTLRDLALSIGWHDLRHFTLAGTEWQVIMGHKRRSDPLRAVLPLPLHTTSLHPSSLRSIFSALGTLTHDNLPPVMEPLAPSVEDLRLLATRRNPSAEEISDDVSVSAGRLASTEVDQADAPTDAQTDAQTEDGSASVNTDNTNIDSDMIYMAIVTADSTVVYYRLSKGIRKPADIPDE